MTRRYKPRLHRVGRTRRSNVVGASAPRKPRQLLPRLGSIRRPFCSSLEPIDPFRGGLLMRRSILLLTVSGAVLVAAVTHWLAAPITAQPANGTTARTAPPPAAQLPVTRVI